MMMIARPLLGVAAYQAEPVKNGTTPLSVTRGVAARRQVSAAHSAHAFMLLCGEWQLGMAAPRRIRK